MTVEYTLTEARKAEIAQNFKNVRERVAAAVSGRERGQGGVSLLAATKHVPPAEIAFAVRELGLRFCGENRSDELCTKFDDQINPYSGAAVHFIGTLQSRKVREVCARVSLIESVDSAKLARLIDAECAKTGAVMGVLAEINIAGEENKSGVCPENFEELASEIDALEHVKLLGGMTMAPKNADFNEYRKYFKETYNIILDFWTKKSHNIREYNSLPAPVISMGMSDSFEAAVAEGANLVRIGSALFGQRNISRL